MPRRSHISHIVLGLALALAAALTVALLAGGCALIPALGPDAGPTPAPLLGTPELTQATVTRITDGDTAHMTVDGSRQKVRFIGIDTPEVGDQPEPFGREAAAYTAAAIPPGTTVWLEFDAERRDEYGRLLAYVWLDSPSDVGEAQVRAKMLNARIVLDGFAHAGTWPPNVKYAELLRACEREARDAARGLWAGE